nr:MAG TPA: hypothetical protein [Bacteriophage sp.]
MAITYSFIQILRRILKMRLYHKITVLLRT